jgi:tetratricopeptide (TPR) repeat protein
MTSRLHDFMTSRPRGFVFLAGFTVIVILLISSFLAVTSQGWQITKELQKEITEKKAAVSKSPKDANARFDLAITYAYSNNILDGWNELKKVNDLDPGYKSIAYTLWAKKVIAEPGNWKVRFRYAFSLYFNGKQQEAIDELQNVLILDPYNVFAWGYISLIYGEMDQVDKAIEAAKKGLKIDDRVAALHLLLAEGYYKKGDTWNGFWERSAAVKLKMQGY